MPDLIHYLEHHGGDKKEIAYFLTMVFTTQLNPAGWQAFHHRSGPNSWAIHLRHKKFWYFTGYETGEIVARNGYWWKDASKQYKLKTRRDVLRFAKEVLA